MSDNGALCVVAADRISGRTVGAFSLAASFALMGLLGAGSAWSQTGPVFTEFATEPGSGIGYQRARSASFADFDAIRQDSLTTPYVPNVPAQPHNPHGQPGVAVLDFDRDGDLDIYVTNGPGAANSLYSNQLEESGDLAFVDVAALAGVDATSQDSTAVCYGDIDNNGYPDILVLGKNEPNRLFKNHGNGAFTEMMASGIEGGSEDSSTCTMGDVNGDGLLDIYIGSVWSQETMTGCILEPFAQNEPDFLYVNNGDDTFTDVSNTSGIRILGGFDPQYEGLPTVTWASAMVDIDIDGDMDIVLGNDQCGYIEERFGGIDRGFLHVLLNDGTGQFSDIPVILNSQAASSWMGLAFGDLNCDGNLDMFATNFGDYANELVSPLPYTLGDETSRWFLGNGDGTFTDPMVGTMATPFGWGTAIFDYDNDGDQDIMYHGGIDLNLVALADNPGVIFENVDCSADFDLHVDSFSTNHIRRTVLGAAIGDLDRNGFLDVVSVSNFNTPTSLPLVPIPIDFFDPNGNPPVLYADVFDDLAHFVPWFDFGPNGAVWNGVDMLPGDLSVELATDNGNNWVRVLVKGMAGVIQDGAVNRDGIGAILTFTPKHPAPGLGLVDGDTVMKPILGGSSYSSQHALEVGFGLGSDQRGRLEVIWPNGVRNRLYNVRKSEVIRFPEIPCSYDDSWADFTEYNTCLTSALSDLVAAGELSPQDRARFRLSAWFAFYDH